MLAVVIILNVMKKIYGLCFYFFGLLFMTSIVINVGIRFWNETLTETQLFLKFWYLIPITLIFGFLFLFFGKKDF